MKNIIDLAINIAIETEFNEIDVNDIRMRKMRSEFIDAYRSCDIFIESRKYFTSGMFFYSEIKPNGIIRSCGMFYV